MGSNVVLEVQKKPTAAVAHKPVLAPQRRFDVQERSESEPSSFIAHRSSFSTPAMAGHAFGSVPLGHESAQSCLLATPRTCPFGGACHTCPTHVQAKLEIGQPDNEYEREADRVAAQVMRMPEPQMQREACSSPSCKEEDEKKMLVEAMPAVGGARAQTDQPLIQKVLSSPGQPLDAATRSFMEPRFGRDFSMVRVHVGFEAAESARAVNARAYTVGWDVVFGDGQYAPGAIEGHSLIAHELAHVVQQQGRSEGIQRTACVDPPGTNLATSVEAPPIREEGDTMTLEDAFGTYTSVRITHRARINQKRPQVSSACECVDAASYSIDVYPGRAAETPVGSYMVVVNMSAKRGCCSTQKGATVNEACAFLPDGFQFEDSQRYSDVRYWNPSGKSDRDILSDVGSAASILSLVLAVIPK